MSVIVRSHRLETLTKLALRGGTLLDLRNKCNQWGVSDSTMRDYLKVVVARIKRMRK